MGPDLQKHPHVECGERRAHQGVGGQERRLGARQEHHLRRLRREQRGQPRRHRPVLRDERQRLRQVPLQHLHRGHLVHQVRFGFPFAVCLRRIRELIGVWCDVEHLGDVVGQEEGSRRELVVLT